jgi:hypothetical protein
LRVSCCRLVAGSSPPVGRLGSACPGLRNDPETVAMDHQVRK